MVEPSPTLHMEPASMTDLAFSMLCHAYELDDFFASNTVPWGKYLALNTWKNKDDWSCNNLQTCLSKHCFIEFYQIFETQTALVFWLAHYLPISPMNFPLLPFLPPPKFPYQHLNIMTKAYRKLETRHGKSWKIGRAHVWTPVTP